MSTVTDMRCPCCKGVLHLRKDNRQDRLECDACGYWEGFVDWREDIADERTEGDTLHTQTD